MLSEFRGDIIRPTPCQFCRLDCSEFDSCAASEMPNVSGGIHRGLDRTRTFRNSGSESASAINHCLRDLANISLRQTNVPHNRPAVHFAWKLKCTEVSHQKPTKEERTRAKWQSKQWKQRRERSRE